MPRWLAWTLGALFVLALGLHAHGPLFLPRGPGQGFSASDLRALLAAGEVGGLDTAEGSGAAFFGAGARGFAAGEHGLRPLGAASLALSTALWSDGGALGAASPRPFRVENLLWYLLAAAGAGVFLRRLVSPWLGDEHGRAAAWVTAAAALVHPLAYAAIGSLGARGDLMALAFGTWSGAQFLRARQARVHRAAIRAGVGTVLASLASPLAMAVPPLLAVAEFVAGRRYRPLAARLRTAAVTGAVYGLCAAVEPALRWFLFPTASVAGETLSATESLAVAVEKLGVLVLSVNAEGLGFAAYLLAAGVLVVALEGAFSAARSAPRLWSTILALGAFSLFSAACAGLSVRVQPRDFTHAEVLLPGALVVSAGLALASTALSGLRRGLMPAILCTGWAALAHGHAAAWSRSMALFDRCRAEVAQAAALEPRPASLLLLDVPSRVGGIEPFSRTEPLDFLASPRLSARDPAERTGPDGRGSDLLWIAAPTREALAHFTRTERFAELRARGIAVARDHGGRGERSLEAVDPPAPTTGTLRWYRDDASTPLDWDALTLRGTSARGPRDTELARAPILGWSASASEVIFESRGVWVDLAGEAYAHFDLAASVDWLLARRIRLAWPVGGWSNLSEADAAPQLARFESLAAPRIAGDDWVFVGVDAPLLAAAEATLARRGERGLLRLLLLDLATLEEARFALEEPRRGPTDATSPDGSLPEASRAVEPPLAEFVARGADRCASRWSRRGRAFAWALEYAASGVVLVRSEGLVVPGAGARDPGTGR